VEFDWDFTDFELYSWRQSLNKVYVELAEQHASDFSIRMFTQTDETD